MRNPKVFLFDEPLSNLDAALRVSMRRELSRLHSDLKATMIYVTHDQVEAMTMADRIVVLDGGVAQQIGTPLELYNRPRNLFVAGFIGSPKMNFLAGKIIGVEAEGIRISTLETGEITVPVADPDRAEPGAKITLGLRPEHLTESAGDLSLEGTVRLTERLGDQTLLEVASDEGTMLIAKAGPLTGATEGDRVRLAFSAHDLHLFDDGGVAFERLAAG